ncbi:MAG: aminopeptidase [Coriobacteriia bacterium]|nr:aminopeptidase [Coriobacteriia bacterium]
MKHINAWTTYSKEDVKKVMKFGEEYRQFISRFKTCREFSFGTIDLAQQAGFTDLNKYISTGTKLKAGDKIYARNQGRLTILAVVGREPMDKVGLNILGAHIDSPRIDIKQNPIYQSDGVVMFETHYYGGINLYQWVNIPLSLHGVVYKTNGDKVYINIGEDPRDPVFFVNDILVHLGHKIATKPANEMINPEKMDLLVGSRPLVKGVDVKKDYEGAAEPNSSVSDPANEACTKFILKLLYDRYGIQERDFESAELEAIPLGEARNCGFDNSMIMGYGHDDSASAYPSLRAILDIEKPRKTCMCILVDKEEVGSLGATGMECRFFENTIAEMLELCGIPGMIHLRRAMARSHMISSDVSAAVDPNFHELFELRNSCFFGDGLVFNKYGGAAGKRSSNDADPEFVAKIRKICDEAKVTYQTAELGAVGVGGGGTIAAIPANYGMHVIDAGVAVLSMHCPWEVVNKADVYESYKGYKAFLRNC